MNLNNSCNNLDAYLSDDVSGSERATFESHLERCAICRDEVAQQHWIDSVLQSPQRVHLEHPSATLLDRFHVSVARRRSRVVQAACGLVAAATLLIAVGGVLKLNQQQIAPAKSDVAGVAVAEPVHVPASAQAPATFISSSDAIAVPLESLSTDVTIVKLYPTTDTERRWSLEQTFLSPSTIPNGG